MRMMTIASGSSGNCIYIGSDNTHILIDAGISRKRIVEGLKKADLSMSDISGVFITHEHSDHIKALGVMGRKDALPVYGTPGTIRGIRSSSSLGEIPQDIFMDVLPDSEICINDLRIRPFRTSHDANEPVAYTVSCGNDKAAVITDLGKYDDYIIENLKDSRAILVEANHDIRMLQTGSYPYYLKERILGDRGHLSNEASGRLMCELVHDRLECILLGHLSKENNYEKLAYETVKLEIDMGDNEYSADDFKMSVAPRDIPSEIIEI